MTEEEWFNSTDPIRMLGTLRVVASDRKLRLFACACCRRIENLFTHRGSRQAVEIAERYADHLAAESELALAFDAAEAHFKYEHSRCCDLYYAGHRNSEAYRNSCRTYRAAWAAANCCERIRS